MNNRIQIQDKDAMSNDCVLRMAYPASCILYLIFLLFPAFVTAQPVKPIVVAADGKGDFKSIQSAINSLPATATEPRIIHIKKGVYNTITVTVRVVLILAGIPTTCQQDWPLLPSILPGYSATVGNYK